MGNLSLFQRVLMRWQMWRPGFQILLLAVGLCCINICKYQVSMILCPKSQDLYIMYHLYFRHNIMDNQNLLFSTVFTKQVFGFNNSAQFLLILSMGNTICPRSSDPYCIVSYYIKWVTTSWTYNKSSRKSSPNIFFLVYSFFLQQRKFSVQILLKP